MKKGLTNIASQQSLMQERLLQLSEINSGTENLAGQAHMCEALKDLFSPVADEITLLESDVHENVDDTGEPYLQTYGKLLSAVKRPHAPFQVLLCGHMDTVFPHDHAFQSPTIVDNTIHGPGAADMKGGLLVMLKALEAFEMFHQTDDLGWRVIINADEEKGSLGSAAILKSAASNAHAGMVFEPALADGTLVRARKGTGNFTLVFHGRSAHAGREFEQGRNAIASMAKVVIQLEKLIDISKGITLNIAKVSGGSAFNVVPDKAVCQINIRTESHDDQTRLAKDLDAIVLQANEEEGIQVELFGQFTRPPKLISDANQLLIDWTMECGQSLDLAMAFKDTGGCCDGNNLAAAGLPNIDTLGVRGGNIHTDKEFMVIESLVERAQLSYLLLNKLANQGQRLVELAP